MQANFQLLTGDSAIGGGLQLPVTQPWAADKAVIYEASPLSLCYQRGLPCLFLDKEDKWLCMKIATHTNYYHCYVTKSQIHKAN